MFIPRMLLALQAFARTVLYLNMPLSQLVEAPEAQFFPGKPAAGTTPTTAPIMTTVRS